MEVSREGKLLSTMPAGKVMGELAILYNCKRTATITGDYQSMSMLGEGNLMNASQSLSERNNTYELNPKIGLILFYSGVSSLFGLDWNEFSFIF